MSKTRPFGFRPNEETFNKYVETIEKRKERGEISQNASIGGELELLMRKEVDRFNSESGVAAAQ